MLEKLYDKLNGFRPGGLYCIASRPVVGKTALMLNIALDYAQKLNKKVLIFSLELSKREICLRIYNIYGEDQNIMELPIYIDDNSLVTPNKVKEEIIEANPDIVFIDYFQLMSGDNKNYDSDIIYDLKCIAKSANIPIVLLSQLRKGRGDLPLLVDLRCSRTTDQSIDVVIFLYDPEYGMRYSKDTRDIEIIIAKNRWGETFTLNSRLDLSRYAFRLKRTNREMIYMSDAIKTHKTDKDFTKWYAISKEKLSKYVDEKDVERILYSSMFEILNKYVG